MLTTQTYYKQNFFAKTNLLFSQDYFKISLQTDTQTDS